MSRFRLLWLPNLRSLFLPLRLLNSLLRSLSWLLNLTLSLLLTLRFAETGVVFVSGPQASADIAVAFVVLVPVSVVVVEVDSPGRPKFLAFPNVDYYASSSSSVEVVGQESVHSSIGARANYGLCSILSNLGLHQNKILEHCYNNPSPGHNNASDTNDLPIDATNPFQKYRSTSRSGST